MKYDLVSIKKTILPILRRHHVKKAGLFGSCVRGKLKKTSDVDILVDITEDINFLDFVGIKLDLEDALGRKVDLVEYSTIKPLLKNRILKEQVIVI